MIMTSLAWGEGCSDSRTPKEHSRPTPLKHLPMAQHGLYQPKIADEHIRQLYQWARRLEMPMTRLVNALLEHALVRLEQGVENVSEATPEAYRRRKTRPEENR